MTTTAIPMAKRASQVERGIELDEASLAISAAYATLSMVERFCATLRGRMTHRLDSLALLLLLPLRGE
jgi:hypothetical protein